jgi:uncharacterized membrane protein (UPF0127 family)
LNAATKNKFSIVILLCIGFSLLRMPSEKLCVDIKNQHVCLRILRNKTDQSRGFQLVETLHPNEGLLYILQDSNKPNFWMKDVVQHLDIVFVDTNGLILEMVEAHPHRSDVITTPKETMYAIEVLGGRAKKLKFMKGSTLPLKVISDLEGAFFAAD